MVTTISHLQPIRIRQEDISALAISSLTHEQNKKTLSSKIIYFIFKSNFSVKYDFRKLFFFK